MCNLSNHMICHSIQWNLDVCFFCSIWQNVKLEKKHKKKPKTKINHSKESDVFFNGEEGAKFYK